MTPLTSGATARRMYGLVEPIGLIPYAAAEPAEALLALGLRNYWDTYFAGRAAPLGRDVPAGVVHAIFYNFAPGEAARHIPRVWDLITPEAALAARDRPEWAHGMVLPSANRRNATEHPDLAGCGPRQRTARTCAGKADLARWPQPAIITQRYCDETARLRPGPAMQAFATGRRVGGRPGDLDAPHRDRVSATCSGAVGGWSSCW
jgi:hypothetical protein